jgi:hypothetical protein
MRNAEACLLIGRRCSVKATEERLKIERLMSRSEGSGWKSTRWATRWPLTLRTSGYALKTHREYSSLRIGSRGKSLASSRVLSLAWWCGTPLRSVDRESVGRNASEWED